MILGDPTSEVGHHGCGGLGKPGIGPSPPAATSQVVGTPVSIRVTPGSTAQLIPPTRTATATPTPLPVIAVEQELIPLPAPRSIQPVEQLPAEIFERLGRESRAYAEMQRAEAVAQAVADLAARLEIDATTIEVVIVENVTWPDSSLGCPEPDAAYLQVLVPGLRIVLAAEDATYRYHTGSGPRVVYCERPVPAVGEGR